jgi:RHS repeat-associated protein
MNKRTYALLMAVILVATFAFAQNSGTGTPRFGSFTGGTPLDVVNNQNLNVHFSLPFLGLAGRGTGFTFSQINDSQIWKPVASGGTTSWTPVVDSAANPTWGWQSGSPTGSTSYVYTTIGTCSVFFPPGFFVDVPLLHLYNWSYTDSGGTQHAFPTVDLTDSCVNNQVVRNPTNPGNSFIGFAGDASGYSLNANTLSSSPTGVVPTGVVTGPDGTQYYGFTGSGYVEDTNGNFISNSFQSPTTTWKDTTGSTALSVTTSANAIQYSDRNGTIVATVNLQSINIRTNFGCPGVVEYSNTATVPVSIVFSNQQTVQFNYEPTPGFSGSYTGRLQKIILPNGGFYEYDYTGANDGINCSDGTALGLMRKINDGIAVHTWIFSRNGNTTTVTAPQLSYDPAGNDTVYTFDANGHETSRKLYQGSASSGTLLRTINTTFAGNGTPATNVTILDGGNTRSEYDSTYDSNGVLQSESSYDYGNNGAHGPLLKTTTYSYLAGSNSNYATRNMINLVSEIKVLDSTGTIKRRAQFHYDEFSLPQSACPTGVAQHDDASYGCSFTFRGNLTSLVAYKDPVTPANPVTRNFTYDVFGNTLTAQVNCCQLETWGFSSATNYSYPDSITSGPSGGPQVIQHYTYNGPADGPAGLVKTFTDENGQVTQYQYDQSGRPSAVIRPDNSQISYSYDDANHTVTTTTPIDSTLSTVQIRATDALGRLSTVTTQDNAGAITPSVVQQQYDELGRLFATSNPYTGSTPGFFTTTRFDALGRAIKTILADGQQTIYTYAQQAITVTDPTGKQITRKSDGVGRLVEVDEPGSGAGTASSGTFTVTGTLQSTNVGGTSATPATGSVTIAPSTGSDRSVTVQTQPATSGTGTVTISGTEQSAVTNCIRNHCITVWDTGSVSITANGHQNSTTYGKFDTASTVATNLANNINGDSGAFVTASASGAVITLTAKTAGASTNYTLSSTSSTNDINDFGGPSFIPTNSGAHLTGGGDAVNTTIYDTGNISITVNGHADQVTFGQNDTAGTITSRLVTAINADTAAFVTASASANVVNLTSKTTGTAANVSLSSAYTFDTAHWSSAFFTTSNSGATLTGGANASGGTTVYDAGTVSVTIGSFNTSVSYSQTGNSTATQVASALAGALSVSNSPVTATSAGANVSMTYKTLGSAGNVAVSVSSTTSQGTYFSSPSFTSSGTTLAGGTDSSGSNATTYAYNVMDQLVTINQGAQTRTINYDAVGLETSEVTPEAGTVTFVHNDFGLPVQRTDNRGVVTAYTYDQLNRLIGKSYPTVPNGVAPMPNNICDPTSPTGGNLVANTCFYYDQGGAAAFAINRTTKMIDASGSETYTYDKMGHITQLSKVINGTNGGNAFIQQYQYNLADGITQVQYPSGRQIKPTFDALGRISGLTDSMGGVNTTYATSFQYNAANFITNFTYGNGVVASYGYSADRLQLTSLSYVKGAQTLFSLTYGYTQNGGNNGQITGITDNVENGRSASYVYDAFGRLQQAYTAGSTNFPKWDLVFGYDRYGNRLNETPQPDTSPNASVPSNVVTVDPVSNRITTSGYSYDASGNITNDGVNALSYDGENRAVSSSGGATATYVYDGHGLRVRKCIPSCTSPTSSTAYVFYSQAVIAEYDNNAAAASPSREYIHSAKGLLATIDSSGTRYHMQDHLSVRMTTDGSGNKTGDQGHFPFGESWYANNTTTKWMYTTYERDSESGNDYAKVRIYVNRLARFNSPDLLPGSLLLPQTLNRYVYAVNDPVNLVDPTGMMSCIGGTEYDFVGEHEWGTPYPDTVEDALAQGWELVNIISSFTCFADPGDRGGFDGGTQGGGGGVQLADIVKQAIRDCAFSVFDVVMTSVTLSVGLGDKNHPEHNTNGSFQGFDILTGNTITITNDIQSKNNAAIAADIAQYNSYKDQIDPKAHPAYTNPKSPTVNYTSNEVSGRAAEGNQIWELGNSLSIIINGVPKQKPQNPSQDPGAKFSNCVFSQIKSVLQSLKK